MKVSHVHLSFTDLKAAIQWMKQIMGLNPGYQNDGMAVFAFANASFIFDQGDSDSNVTIALSSEDCEKDFTSFQEKGADVLESPSAQPWGVKTAYFKGPGAVVFEIEEILG